MSRQFCSLLLQQQQQHVAAAYIISHFFFRYVASNFACLHLFLECGVKCVIRFGQMRELLKEQTRETKLRTRSFYFVFMKNMLIFE